MELNRKSRTRGQAKIKSIDKHRENCLQCGYLVDTLMYSLNNKRRWINRFVIRVCYIYVYDVEKLFSIDLCANNIGSIVEQLNLSPLCCIQQT